MRPIRLVLENFGAYRERAEVDFGRLGPVFLVWGKTGSGKTTIFDALTYALYGAAPGSRAGLEKQLCSQYAKPGEKPLVEFEFALGGELLRATRIPPYRRLNRRGEEAEVPAAARLERREGEAWVLLAEKIGEVDEGIRRRLGLSAEEFSKIILLPQGEFQRFLEMDSSERVAILEKLFPVELHEALTLLVRERAKAALEEARRLDAELARLAAEGGGEGGSERRAALAELAAEREAGRQAALAALREADAALGRGREAAERRANLERAEAALTALEAGAEAARERRARVEAGRRAAPLIPLLEAEARGALALRHGLEESGARGEALEATEARRPEAEAARAEAELAAVELERMDREIGELEKAALAWRGLGRAEEELGAARRALAEAEGLREGAARAEAAAREREALSAVSPEEGEAAAAEVQAAQEALQGARELEARAREAEEAARRLGPARAEAEGAQGTLLPLEREIGELEEARDRALAASLALGLHPGSPCPVCGSTEHPRPAAGGSDWDAGRKARLEAARARREALLKEAAAAAARRAEAQAALAEAESRLAQALPEGAGLPSAEEAQALRLAAQERRSRATQAQQALEARRRTQAEAGREREAARAALEQAERSLGEARIELARREEALNQARSHAGGEDPGPRLLALTEGRRARDLRRRSALELAEAWGRELARAADLAAESAGRLPGLKAEAERAAQAAREALAAAGFPGAEAAREAALPPPELARLEAAASAYEVELAAARAGAEEARRALGAAPGLGPEPGLAALEESAALARSALDEAQAGLEAAREELSRLERLLAEGERLLAERRALSERSGRLSGLAALLAGEIPGRRLPFKNFVLGAYFRRVVELASLRLGEMSEGRYGLLADEGQGAGRGRIGLELLVRDAYTGRTRPAGTLSGGERFLSSLALALGLADAIRSRSGGVDLDAVFIDEGFGSLDEEALDRAIAALDRARGARTIGIVSHVAELRSRIPSRIEVRKGRGGSSLEILG